MLQSRQIQAFRAVMVTGTMTGAAEAIRVTQPAISRLIRDLEAEVGFPLFDRRGNLVKPTADARALLTEVERSFVGLERILTFAKDLRSGQGGTVKIAALPAMAAGFLPRFVAAYSRQRPRINILISGMSSNDVRLAVEEGQFDLGFTAYHPGLKGYPWRRSSLAVTPLNDGAVVAMQPDHHLTRRSVLRAEDLEDEALILLSAFSANAHPLGTALQTAIRRAPIETPLATIACVLVSAGAGIAIVDRFSASEFVGRNVVVRPFEPSSIIGTAIVTPRQRSLSIVASEFQAAFVEHVRRFLE
jgi:DNA-binding transcriptional LysR family regulator